MKILNIVLSILILVLAIASAVFSYMLFEKRSNMVGGYEELRRGISDATRTLQADTGKDIASQMNVDYKKSESLSSDMSKLTNFARQVSSQRNELANALSEMAKAAGVTIDPADFINLETGLDKVAEAKFAVQNLRANRDDLSSGIAQGVAQFGLTASIAKLNSTKPSDWKDEIAKFNSELKNVQNYKKQQESVMRQIAKALGKDITLSPARYADDLKSYNEAITNLIADKSALEKAKAQLTKDVAAANANLKAKAEEIATLNAEVKQGQEDFTRITAILEGNAIEFPVRMWRPGSEEARKAVQGKIIAIDERFGYVTIDLGSESVVQQVIANNLDTNPVNPMIAEGDEMLVAKGATTKYIGSISIYKVDENCAFARVTNAVDGAKLAVGDSIYFDSEKVDR